MDSFSFNILTINKIVKNGFKSDADVKHFFTEVRLLFEKMSTDKEKYRVVKFYGDWMLHIKKDNLKGLSNYFNELNDMLNKNEILPDKHEFNKKICVFTSFIELKEQLNELLKNYRINNLFINSENEWKNFCIILRKLIIKKPIYFDRLKVYSPRRKMVLFVIDEIAPFMIDIKGSLYWMLFINTSDFPISGVISESIGLKNN